MRHTETIKFENIEEFCDIGSVWELYDRWGLLDRIKSFEIASPNHICISEDDSKRLQEIIKAEVRRRSKKDRVWSRVPAVPSKGCLFEWLTFGPLVREEVPNGEVYIYSESEFVR